MVAVDGRWEGHQANIFPGMRFAMRSLPVLLALAACRNNARDPQSRHALLPDPDSLEVPDSATVVLKTPRVVTEPSVIVFWLAAGDTLNPEDANSAYDDLTYYTQQVAPTLKANNIKLLPTNADTVYIQLANHKRRAVLLSGLDYPFGYLLVDPGGPERILTGVYSDDDLLDELRAYFDISTDSTHTAPRVTT